MGLYPLMTSGARPSDRAGHEPSRVSPSRPVGDHPSRAALLQGPRYSPNLRKWYRHRGGGSMLPGTQVFQAPDGVRYIGRRFDDDNWTHAANLMRVLCVGSRADTYAYSPEQSADWEPIEGFWERYSAIGRCAIDPEHTGWWHGDRWNENGDARECLWCGLRQHVIRWTETVERERWENAASGTEAGTGETEGLDPKDDGPVGNAETPNPCGDSSHD